MKRMLLILPLIILAFVITFAAMQLQQSADVQLGTLSNANSTLQTCLLKDNQRINADAERISNLEAKVNELAKEKTSK